MYVTFILRFTDEPVWYVARCIRFDVYLNSRPSKSHADGV